MSAAIAPHRDRQEDLGQFLTGAPVADFMASMFGPLPSVDRLLDAGAGAGALTRAFVSRFCEKQHGVRAIEATLYELDPNILDALTATMRKCQRICSSSGIPFTFTIHATDFIQEMSACLSDDLFGATPPEFDAAITNPPYRKISTDSAERHSLRSVGVETSNLYKSYRDAMTVHSFAASPRFAAEMRASKADQNNRTPAATAHPVFARPSMFSDWPALPSRLRRCVHP